MGETIPLVIALTHSMQKTKDIELWVNNKKKTLEGMNVIS